MSDSEDLQQIKNIQTYFDRANKLIVLMDRDKHISYINPYACELLEYKKKELLGKNWFRICIPEQHRSEFIELFNRNIAKGTTLVDQYSAPVLLKSGKEKLVTWCNSAINNEDNEIVTILRIGKQVREQTGDKKGLKKEIGKSMVEPLDLISQIEAQQLLKESEAKFRTLAEQSIFGTLIMQENEFKYVNKRMAELTGYSVEEMLKWGPLEFLNTVHPEDKQRILRNIQARSEEGNEKEHHYTFRGFKKNGELIWGELYSKPILYQGKPANIITIADITDKKKTEQDYKKAYNRAEFYKDLFAHDINNILQNIHSANELCNLYLGSEDFPEKFRELTNIIDSQISRGSQLVSNIRTLSQLEEGDIGLEKRDLIKILEHAIQFVKKSYKTKIIEIFFDSPKEEIVVYANDLLLDAFENILNNAVKHNKSPKVKIWVEVTRFKKDQKEYMKVEIKDNGIGILDQRKSQLFSDSIRKPSESEGLGLGLSLVKKVIQAHNGLIWVENRIQEDSSQGSNFVILIPEVVADN